MQKLFATYITKTANIASIQKTFKLGENIKNLTKSGKLYIRKFIKRKVNIVIKGCRQYCISFVLSKIKVKSKKNTF